jgi:hypothetical protein
LLTSLPASVGPATVQCEPPRDADKPGTKALPLPQLPESPVCPYDGVLGHVFGILAAPKDRECHPDEEARNVGEDLLELSISVGIRAH